MASDKVHIITEGECVVEIKPQTVNIHTASRLDANVTLSVYLTAEQALAIARIILAEVTE